MSLDQPEPGALDDVPADHLPAVLAQLLALQARVVDRQADRSPAPPLRDETVEVDSAARLLGPTWLYHHAGTERSAVVAISLSNVPGARWAGGYDRVENIDRVSVHRRHGGTPVVTILRASFESATEGVPP
jgi:hypothetical protein